MYNCVINIKTFDCEKYIIDVISEAEAPYECEIKLLPEGEDCSDSPDSLIVFGSMKTYTQKREAVKSGYSVVIADEKTAVSDISAENTDIWMLPEGYKDKAQLVKAYFSRLIGNIKRSFDCRRYKICLETTIDSVPDLVWYKDMRGAHVLTNDSFCDAVDKTKEQVYKKGHFYIWDIPQEEYEQGDYVCLESEEIVINAGKTCYFDEKVKTKRGMKQFKTYKSPLYDVNGELFGTCGIAVDMTDLDKIDSELRVILESVPYGIMLEDNDGKLVSANCALRQYFPEIEEYIGKQSIEWKRSTDERCVRIGENAYQIGEGEESFVLSYRKQQILDALGEEIGVVFVFRDITAEKLLHDKTREHANTDFLTGLNNRRSLFSHLSKIKDKPQLSMITIDLDNFKKVNDVCGHKAGDNVLVETARMMQECFPKDFIARLGGDEFLVVISRQVEQKELADKTQSFIDTFIERFSDCPEMAVMTVSAGISSQSGAHNAEQLMHNSDSALYKAKKSGKSKYCFYEEE